MKKNNQATESNTQDRQALSRRDFLAKTAMLGAGLAVGPLLLAACANQPKESANTSNKGLDSGKNKMKTRKLGKLEVSEIGAGAMSISANYGPPQTENKASRSFVQPMKKASRSSTQPKFTAPIQAKSLSEKHSLLSATKSLSRVSSGSSSMQMEKQPVV